jgi:hypothetical protein
MENMNILSKNAMRYGHYLEARLETFWQNQVLGPLVLSLHISAHVLDSYRSDFLIKELLLVFFQF